MPAAVRVAPRLNSGGGGTWRTGGAATHVDVAPPFRNAPSHLRMPARIVFVALQPTGTDPESLKAYFLQNMELGQTLLSQSTQGCRGTVRGMTQEATTGLLTLTSRCRLPAQTGSRRPSNTWRLPLASTPTRPLCCSFCRATCHRRPLRCSSPSCRVRARPKPLPWRSRIRRASLRCLHCCWRRRHSEPHWLMIRDVRHRAISILSLVPIVLRPPSSGNCALLRARRASLTAAFRAPTTIRRRSFAARVPMRTRDGLTVSLRLAFSTKTQYMFAWSRACAISAMSRLQSVPQELGAPPVWFTTEDSTFRYAHIGNYPESPLVGILHHLLRAGNEAARRNGSTETST